MHNKFLVDTLKNNLKLIALISIIIHISVQLIFVYRTQTVFSIQGILDTVTTTKPSKVTSLPIVPVKRELIRRTFPTIHIITPTYIRKQTGYTYLEDTFDSFEYHLGLFNLEFTLNAFQRETPDSRNHTPPSIESNRFSLNYFKQSQAYES